MIYNLPIFYQKDPNWEASVRHRMAQDDVPEHAYEYLVVKPYPTPDDLRFWLQTQFPDSGQYLAWKGWLLFQNQSDALLAVLTWMK
jgi:hypothetical protein